MISLRHVAMETKHFLDNAIYPGNHHTQLEICLVYCWLYINPGSEQIFHRFVLQVVGMHVPAMINALYNETTWTEHYLYGKLNCHLIHSVYTYFMHMNSIAALTCHLNQAYNFRGIGFPPAIFLAFSSQCFWWRISFVALKGNPCPYRCTGVRGNRAISWRRGTTTAHCVMTISPLDWCYKL